MNYIKIFATAFLVAVSSLGAQTTAQQSDTTARQSSTPDTSKVESTAPVSQDTLEAGSKDTTTSGPDTAAAKLQPAGDDTADAATRSPDTLRMDTTTAATKDTTPPTGEDSVVSAASTTPPQQNTATVSDTNSEMRLERKPPSTVSSTVTPDNRPSQTSSVSRSIQTQDAATRETEMAAEQTVADTSTIDDTVESAGASQLTPSVSLPKPQESESNQIPFWVFVAGGIILLGLILTITLMNWPGKSGDLTEGFPGPHWEPEQPTAATRPKEIDAGESKEILLDNRRLLFSTAQHIGKQREQQDTPGFLEPEDANRPRGFLMLVADGMDGHKFGKEASGIAAEKFIAAYKSKSEKESVEDALNRALRTANKAVVSFARKMGAENNSGTTLTAAVIQGNSLHWIAVGDTRLYLLRNGELKQLNGDQVYLQKLLKEVAAGRMSKSEAATHPQRNALYSFIGLKEIHEIDANERPYPLRADDRILICSEGWYGQLTEGEIKEALAGNPGELANMLVHKVLAKKMPRQNNMTAATIVIREAGPEETE